MADTTQTQERIPIVAACLDEVGAAKYIAHSRRTLEAWRAQGRGPAYLRIGGRVRYLITDLDGWLREQRVEPAAATTEA